MVFENKVFFSYLEGYDIEGAVKYAEEHIPEYLYKFYSLSDCHGFANKKLDKRKLYTLKNGSNWFDLSRNQNDPLDMKMPCVEEEHGKGEEKAIGYFLNQFRNNCLLCSFSDIGIESLPMWAFYANNHRGYCVKYKVLNKKIVWKIMYENNRMPIYSIPLHLFEEMDKSNRLGYETEELIYYRYLMYMIMNTKHISWSAESEYRILYPVDKPIGQNVDNELLGLKATDVYVGVKCNAKYEKKIKAICKHDIKCSCWKAYVSETKILDFMKTV